MAFYTNNINGCSFQKNLQFIIFNTRLSAVKTPVIKSSIIFFVVVIQLLQKNCSV